MEAHSETLEARRSPGMARARRASIPDTVAQAVSGLTEGVSTLVRGHLALARVEAARDVKALGRDAAMGLSGAPMLMVGYLLLWVGLGLLLALAIPSWASFLLCAAANFGLGAALMLWGRARIREGRRLPSTVSEVRRDREWLGELREERGARLH